MSKQPKKQNLITEIHGIPYGFDEMGHHALAQEAASPYWFEWCGVKLNTHGMWLIEQMRERDEWLERFGSSRHSYGQSSSR